MLLNLSKYSNTDGTKINLFYHNSKLSIYSYIKGTRDYINKQIIKTHNLPDV